MVVQDSRRPAGAPSDVSPRRVPGLQGGRYLAAAAVAIMLTFSAAPASAAPKQTKAEKDAAKLIKLGPSTVLPLRFTDVVVRDGQLVALGTLGTTPFEAPITLEAMPMQPGQTCPILHLMLGPIDLNLLGLGVQTSEICLFIDAHQGGGLLGDLLCGVSHLLDGGGSLGDILGGLSAANLATLLDGITELLNGALDAVTSPAAVVGVSDSGTGLGHCDILNLSLGPVDLNLLGLEVQLNNCDNPPGPVTVDVFAVPGPGNLLGNLLCGLSGLLDNGANTAAIARSLNRIADEIEAIIGVL